MTVQDWILPALLLIVIAEWANLSKDDPKVWKFIVLFAWASTLHETTAAHHMWFLRVLGYSLQAYYGLRSYDLLVQRRADKAAAHQKALQPTKTTRPDPQEETT